MASWRIFRKINEKRLFFSILGRFGHFLVVLWHFFVVFLDFSAVFFTGGMPPEVFDIFAK